MAPHLQLLWLPLLSISFISLLNFSLATVYTVGGPTGWTTPSRAKLNYTEWSANTPFKVGDTLEFNYVYKAHTVLEVIRSDFRYCNTTSPLATFADPSGRTVVVLSKPGNYYFIDGVGDHCAEGQKFEAKVLGTAALEPAMSPSSSSLEPSASPAIPPATASSCTASTSIALMLISFIFLVLLSSPKNS